MKVIVFLINNEMKICFCSIKIVEYETNMEYVEIYKQVKFDILKIFETFLELLIEIFFKIINNIETFRYNISNLAPEVVQNSTFSTATDMWNLGLIIFILYVFKMNFVSLLILICKFNP